MSPRERVDVDDFVDTLDYPMFVVTTAYRGRRHGCLVGFATQTSIDPPRLLVCLSRANATTRRAGRARFFGVHQLARDDQELSRLFGEETGDRVDKFARCAWEPGPHGVPLLADATAWLVGRVEQRLDLGDHLGVLLQPVATGRRRAAAPLMFRDARDMEPGHPA